ELKPDVRRRLLNNERKKLNINEIEESETNGQTGASIRSSLGQRVLAALDHDAAKGLDPLIDQIEDASASEVIAALFELELNGMIRQLPGKSYIKVWVD